jgi:hypothetical protein
LGNCALSTTAFEDLMLLMNFTSIARGISQQQSQSKQVKRSRSSHSSIGRCRFLLSVVKMSHRFSPTRTPGHRFAGHMGQLKNHRMLVNTTTANSSTPTLYKPPISPVAPRTIDSVAMPRRSQEAQRMKFCLCKTSNPWQNIPSTKC